MSEKPWHEARLIPTSGIGGPEEQETRATSALLAVMAVVRDFAKAICQPLGAPTAPLQTYIEVPFKIGKAKDVRPDGLIRAVRGGKTWTALVEVKTGTHDLDTEQVTNYVELAKQESFDVVLTISNQVPAQPGTHPTPVDGRLLRKVRLAHLSWSEILTHAVLAKEHRGVSDPEQSWILGELIRYLEHPKSGALSFGDMGASWTTVRDGIAASTIRRPDQSVREVAQRWDALLRHTSLELGRALGAEVTPVLSRAEIATPSVRADAVCQQLITEGKLTGEIRIPSAVSSICVIADLRASRLRCTATIDAPPASRQRTKVNWILKQLADAAPTTEIETVIKNSRLAPEVVPVESALADPDRLVPGGDREIRAFRVGVAYPLGAGRKTGRSSFIDSVQSGIENFYGDVLTLLKSARTTPPPRRVLPEIDQPDSTLSSTALSSQDPPEIDLPADAPTAPPTSLSSLQPYPPSAPTRPTDGIQ